MENKYTSNIPAEKKLELVRLMRSESHQNRRRMRGREQILYEGDVPAEYVGRMSMEKHVPDSASGFSSFKLRLLAAFLLFAAFVAWDNGYYPALPENDGQLYSIIEEDMLSANLFAFMEDFTYTLED